MKLNMIRNFSKSASNKLLSHFHKSETNRLLHARRIPLPSPASLSYRTPNRSNFTMSTQENQGSDNEKIEDGSDNNQVVNSVIPLTGHADLRPMLQDLLVHNDNQRVFQENAQLQNQINRLTLNNDPENQQ